MSFITRTYQPRTLLGIFIIFISMLCAYVCYQTAPKTRYNHAKALCISIGASVFSCHIFLSLYWQSLPPIFFYSLQEHSHHYFTRRPLYFDIWCEISVLLLAVLRKRLFGKGFLTLSKFYGEVLISGVKSQFCSLQFLENDCLGKDFQL